MAEQNQENNDALSGKYKQDKAGLDAAGKSLSDALRISFVILKVIMIALVVVFVVSGFRTIEPDEQALVLRFGKIRGAGEEKLLEPGLHWVLPYPIHEIIKIPVGKKVNLPINSFWYYQKSDELLPEGPENRPRIEPVLYPVRDGYCITRNEKQSKDAIETGGDYNIVHCKWQLTYQIDDPEEFFRNVYVATLKPGEVYFDVITQSVRPLLKSLTEDAVVTAMVNYTIDEALLSREKIPRHVHKLLQAKLDAVKSGIKVVSIQLTDIVWPRQVNFAFQASITASQMSQMAISRAKGLAENTLNEAAGPVAEELLAALQDETVTEEEKEVLWSQLAGEAQGEIAGARAYRRKVVESARANARYLQTILPEYRERPELVIQNIYKDAIEYVLSRSDEKIIVQPAEGAKGRELRIMLNRDPSIKPQEQLTK